MSPLRRAWKNSKPYSMSSLKIAMYKFSLEPVLNQRKLIEENLQKELAVFKKSLAEEKRKLRTYKRTKDKFLRKLQQKREESITISEMLLYVRFIERLSRDLEKQREKVLEVEKELDQKREALIEAMKNRKTLEKLKEKEWKTFRQQLTKKELDFLDEAAINRFHRTVQA